jgi:basic membrane protein A and related proteins
LRTRIIVMVLALTLALTAVGCGGSGGGGGGSSSDVKPGLVLDVGGLGDEGFNDSAYAGFKRAKKNLGVKGDYLESTAPTDYTDNLTQFADSGYNPVIAVGFAMAPDLSEVSKQYTDTQFAIVDAVVDTPNTISLVFREQEGSYLAGVVAGLMTQEKTAYTNPDKVVGFLGGQTGPLIGRFQAGYEAGVKSVCPDCKVLVNYAGSTVDAYNDPAKGKEISLQQIDQGADIIYTAAGNTGTGGFSAAKQEKIFAIGVDQDQAKLFPEDPILTSVIKRVDNAVYQMIVSVSKNNGKPKGEVVDSGLKEKGISLAPYGRFDKDVPQSVKDEVAKAKKGIIDGDIKVPTKP